MRNNLMSLAGFGLPSPAFTVARAAFTGKRAIVVSPKHVESTVRVWFKFITVILALAFVGSAQAQTQTCKPIANNEHTYDGKTAYIGPCPVIDTKPATEAKGLKFVNHTIGETISEYKSIVSEKSHCDNQSDPAYNSAACDMLKTLPQDHLSYTVKGSTVTDYFKNDRLVKIVFEPGLFAGQNLIEALVSAYGDPSSRWSDGGGLQYRLWNHASERLIWNLTNGKLTCETYYKKEIGDAPMYRAIIE